MRPHVWFGWLATVLNVDPESLSDPTALSQNLARRPRAEPLTMDLGAVSAFQGMLRAAQAKGAVGAIVPGPPSGPGPRITAAMERARRRPARQLQVRQSEELVEQFLQEVARQRRPTRARLTGEVAEALAVLQAAARQISHELADRWLGDGQPKSRHCGC